MIQRTVCSAAKPAADVRQAPGSSGKLREAPGSSEKLLKQERLDYLPSGIKEGLLRGPS